MVHKVNLHLCKADCEGQAPEEQEKDPQSIKLNMSDFYLGVKLENVEIVDAKYVEHVDRSSDRKKQVDEPESESN